MRGDAAEVGERGVSIEVQTFHEDAHGDADGGAVLDGFGELLKATSVLPIHGREHAAASME